MHDKRPRSSRLAAIFIALGLSIAAGGIAINEWMLRVTEWPPAATGVIEPANAAAVLRLMSLALVAGFVVVVAFTVGSFVMVRAGRCLVARSFRPAGGVRPSMEVPGDEIGTDPRRDLNWPV